MEPDEFQSTYAWYEHHGLEWPDDVPAEKRQEWLAVREAVWNRHYASLSPRTRALLAEGRHASDSWEHAEEAERYATALAERLEGVAYVRGVSVGFYHGDTLVLTVAVDGDVSWHEFGRDVPELFEGFQVFVSPRDA
jgi:hypothetical protein